MRIRTKFSKFLRHSAFASHDGPCECAPLRKGRRRRVSPQTRGRRLAMESLEDRNLLALFIVNNTFDLDPDGNVIPGTLRRALQLANATDDADDIVFADFLLTDPTTRVSGAQTIVVSSGENGGALEITQPVRILGPGANALTIRGTGGGRIFDINIGADDEFSPVHIGGMTLTGGAVQAGRGGAIQTRENLTLTEVVIRGNSADQGGGAVYVERGRLQLNRSVIGPGNTSGGGGGGIYVGDEGEDTRPIVTILNSTITGNTTSSIDDHPGVGGGLFTRNGTVSIDQSTVTANSAAVLGGGVATYGVVDPTMDLPIVTSLNGSIFYGNLSGSDVGAVRQNVEGDALVPSLNILDYNFIGTIAGAAQFAEGENANFNFYQVVAAPDGIDWNTANRAAGILGGGNKTTHLVTFSGPADDALAEAENDFVATLIDDARYWREFVPTAPAEAPPEPQNIGPWMGGLQVDVSLNPDGGWAWVTDPVVDSEIAPFGYTNWATGQPDDGELITEPEDPPMLPEEDRIAFFTDDSATRGGTWGDLMAIPDSEQLPIAYVIEFDQGTNYFGVDPLLLPLGDYGGSVPVHYLEPTSAAIDAGDPAILPGEGPAGRFEQRGRHFGRVRSFTPGEPPVIDVGAVEVQKGVFVVDYLFDESDGQYSGVWRATNDSGRPALAAFANPYETIGDFNLREAVHFSERNPEFDTIRFSSTLVEALDPTFSSNPTMLLKTRSTAGSFSALQLTKSVSIDGPTDFVLEIDAGGIDPTPAVDNFDGARVFLLDDGDANNDIDVFVNNLTLLGGDVINRGGAIHSKENLSVLNSTFLNNSASVDGGAIYAELARVEILSSTFTDNFASRDGGAVYVGAGSPGQVQTAVISNSTISGNRAGNRGAGVANGNGDLQILFSTITNNTSGSTRGSGVASLNGGSTLTRIGSSIIVGNSNTDVEFLGGAVTVNSRGFNLVGVGNGGVVFNQPGDVSGLLSAGLAPLSDNGGRNKTHRLLPGSPAIDKGDSVAVAGVAGVPLHDERGVLFSRVFDGDQDTKNRIDIGAYELQPTVFTVDSASDENDGNIGFGQFSLREAIAAANLNPLTDTIQFSPELEGATIVQSDAFGLASGTTPDIQITDSLNIFGLGDFVLTLNGSGGLSANGLVNTRWFTIDDGNPHRDIVVNIRDLTFTESVGKNVPGAVIHSVEDLTLRNVSFVNNSTYGPAFHGGAIYQGNGSLLLDNVTLTGNRTDGVGADGGALFAVDADVTLQSSSVTGNSTLQTQADGGALYVLRGTLTMRDTTITGNATPGGNSDGGGLAVKGVSAQIHDSVISGNLTTGSNSEGAGIRSDASVVVINNSTLSLNRSTGTQSSGAALFVNGGSVELNDAIIARNRTEGLLAHGGGIAVAAGSLIVNRSPLINNQTAGTTGHGGAIHNAGGAVIVRGSTLSANQLLSNQSKGGAVYHEATLPAAFTLIENSTLSGNQSLSQGGAVYNRAGDVQIHFSTLTLNSVPNVGNGGGVASFAAGGATTRVMSSIIAGNLRGDVDRVGGLSSATFQSLGYNVIGTGLSTPAFNAVGDQTGVVDPKLGPLTINGGPTLTHAPLEGSPAVNAGNPTHLAGRNGVPPYDQRSVGFARVRGGRIDVGAVETAFSAIAADFDNDEFVSGFDFLILQRGFGKTNAVKADGDANNDRLVTGSDFSAWGQSFGVTAASGGPGPQSAAASEASAAPIAIASATAPLEDHESTAPVTTAGTADNSAAVGSGRAAAPRRPLFASADGQAGGVPRTVRPALRHDLSDSHDEARRRRLPAPIAATHAALVSHNDEEILERNANRSEGEFASDADEWFGELGQDRPL